MCYLVKENHIRANSRLVGILRVTLGAPISSHKPYIPPYSISMKMMLSIQFCHNKIFGTLILSNARHFTRQEERAGTQFHSMAKQTLRTRGACFPPKN